MRGLEINWKNNYIRVFLLGLVTSLAFFLPFLIMDKGLFLYYGDFNVQQIPFYSLAHDAVRSGDIFWNWNTDLGVNFVGSYSFYLLGSPFFWLTLLFPSAAVPYLMAPLLMLKFAFTGVTAYAYIRRFTKKADTAMIGGLLYAFTGFNLYNIFFNHFSEAVMAFPLLLIAMEELIINNRRGGFALAVAFCAVINYYFFFGEVLFCILYFFLRGTSTDFPIRLKKFLILVFEAVLGVLLAAFILLPSFWAVIQNPRTGEMLTGFDMLFYGNVQRYGLILSSFFFPPDIPARPNFFPDSNAKWSSVSMYLPLISMSGVFAFFMGKKKHWAKTLLLICFAICFIPILNSAFSLFNYSYYARWFFMPLLIMALASCIALEDHIEKFRPALIWTAVFVGAFALIGVLPKRENGELIWFKLENYPERLWVYVLIALVGLLCTSILVILTTRHKYFTRCAVASICIITVVTGSFIIFTGKQAAGNDYYNQVVNEALYGREKLSLEEDGFYRIDTYDELDNLGMFWRIPTINAFHSVVPASIMEYYELIGGERGVASRPKPELTGVRNLLSVKYRFISERQKNASPPNGFRYYGTQNGFRIYQNEHFIPMGFTYDYCISYEQLNDCSDGYKDRLLLKGLLLSDGDQEKYRNILPLLSDRQTLPDTMDDNEFFAACDKRAASAVKYFSYNSRGFTAQAELPRENLVFFSVPYDSGWSASVNGKPVDIVKANGGFMAVPASEGESRIVFTYHTKGLISGLMISGFSLLLLFAYLLYIRRLRRCVPETRYQKFAHRYRASYIPMIPAKTAYQQKLERLAKSKENPPGQSGGGS